VSSLAAGSGREVDYTYDALDHVTGAVYKNATGSTVATISYQYDKDGHLTSMTDGTGTTTDTYDGLGRLTETVHSDGTTDDYAFDPVGNMTSLTNAGGKVTYVYDKANELTKVFDPGATAPTATMTYDSDGNLQSTTYPSGASTTTSYDAIDEPTKVTNTYKTSSGTLAHLTSTYSYDGSLIASVTDQSGNITSYTYDALNRLTEAKTTLSGTTVSDYQYALDPTGNVTSAVANGTTTTFAHNSANEICWQKSGSVASPTCASPPAGASVYSYDGDGNELTNGAGVTATYNGLGQTASITSNSTTADYSYSGEGQVNVTGEGSAVLHNDKLGLAYKTSSAATTYYTRTTTGRQIDERTPTATYYYLYDEQGSVVGLVDSAGHLANHYGYDPYGSTISGTGTAPNPFGFQDGYETTSGLYHFGARFDSPAQFSWTQPDPSGHALVSDPTQSSSYSFTSDNPVNATDPSGNVTCAQWRAYCNRYAATLAAAECHSRNPLW
jgi:RHS repeat-associated protein